MPNWAAAGGKISRLVLELGQSKIQTKNDLIGYLNNVYGLELEFEGVLDDGLLRKSAGLVPKGKRNRKVKNCEGAGAL